MADISVELCGLHLRNPLILASGVFGLTAKSLYRIAKAGAGAVVTKSIGLKPNKGYSNPTVVLLPHGILNALGLPNPGIQTYKKEFATALKLVEVPVIGSVYGCSASEFVTVVKEFEKTGASAVELNMSCPHSKYGIEVGRDLTLMRKIIKSVKECVTVPVFVKISPEIGDLMKVAATIACDADCIVVTNTLKATAINIEVGKPVLSNCIGGYSGPALKPIGVRCVYEIAKEVDIPIVGVGGIVSWQDVVEYLMAGATAVQIGSGIYYKGLEIFQTICNGLKRFCNTHNYRKITDFIGIAHRR